MLMILVWFSYVLIIDFTVDISRVLLLGFPHISGVLLDDFSQCLNSLMRIESMCYCLLFAIASLFRQRDIS